MYLLNTGEIKGIWKPIFPITFHEFTSPFCEFIATEGTFVAHKKGITQHISRRVQFPITLPF